jgi:O-antigen ligase
MFFCITSAYCASVVYDTIRVKSDPTLATPVALVVVASLAAAFILQKYPVRVIPPFLLDIWPLHLFTLSFFAVCFVFHGGVHMGQVIIYTILAYATYALLPLLITLDARLFGAFVRLISILSACLAIPSMFGAMGYNNLAGIPLRIKQHYAALSGIIASGGVFEHPEGHALQMGLGLLCSLYLISKCGRIGYYLCFLLALIGLVISQGRAAMLGMVIALAFRFLPELFHRSRLIFVGSLVTFLIIPFVLWTQMAALPGVSGYLRLQRGLSGRDVAWRYAMELIKEEPWIGHGFLSSSELTESHRVELRKSGFSGVGTTFHNTFITRAVELGLVTTFFYSLLYVVPFVRICRPSQYPDEQHLVRAIILLTLTTCLFRDYNVGGVRSTALTGAVFLGLANLWHFVPYWGQVESPAEADAAQLPLREQALSHTT